MNKFFTLLMSLATTGIAYSQCAEVDEPKVLLVGDSWAFFMTVDGTFNNVFNKWGHTDCEFYSNAIIAENGAETDDFLTQAKQDEIAAQLNAKPSIEVVHLSIGGNDVLGDWNINYSPEQTDSLKNAVKGRLIQVIDFIKSVKPGIRIVWSGYAYPNFEEVIESAAPFQTSHPFYGTWEGMGFPTFLQINTLLNEFSEEVAAYAASDPQVDFIPATALMQYKFGQNSPLGVAPGGTYPPYTVPLPEGNPVYPSPKSSMRDYGITKDCFHLSASGFFDLIEFHTQKFYHKFLMHDLYVLSENNAQTGSVTSLGNTSNTLQVGESGGESFSALLSFNTTAMPDTFLSKASLFLRRESLTGNNPISGSLEVKVVSGNFGASANVEATDYTATADATGTPCLFGSNNNNEDWIRLDLPGSFFPYINNGAPTQFIVSAPGVTNAKVTFSNSSDPDFAPILDLTYGPNTLSVDETANHPFSIFPNPTSGLVTIDSQGGTVTSVEVLDVLGKTVFYSTAQQNTVDISALPAGTYIMKVKTDIGKSSQRIVKL